VLGDAFLYGQELLPEAESIGWLERAAAHGHPQATYELALYRGEDSWPPPEGTATAALLLRAAELGCADAQYDLGTMFATGVWESSVGPAQARAWYRKAAEQGLAPAQSNLAAMLLDGGAPSDENEGLRWLQAAAERSDPEALRRLEEAYRQGLHGLTPDADRAESLNQRFDDYLDKCEEQRRRK
jgi:TPR repeat protein